MDLEAETDSVKSVRVALIGGNASSMTNFVFLVISTSFLGAAGWLRS